MVNKVNHIYINFLVYGAVHLESGLSHLESILNRMLPGVPRTWLIVDNAVTHPSSQQISACRWMISGENSIWEFSGWDRGYQFIKEQFNIQAEDVILYANDTFHRRAYSIGGNSFLDEFNAKLIHGHDLTRDVVGYLDDFPREVSLMGISYDSWIRSNIFITPAEVAERLYPLAFPLSPDKIFSADMHRFWGQTNTISENWKAYISSWLFGIDNPEYPEYRLHWLKAQPLTSENWEFFKTKALCILSEHYLTARLCRWGVPIINANCFVKKADRHLIPYYEHLSSTPN